MQFQTLKKFPTICQSYESPPHTPPHSYDGMSINDLYKKYTNDSSVTCQ
jgi:hypothetical protein